MRLSFQFGYKSIMEVPRITKITPNMGAGEAVGDKKVLDYAGWRSAEDRRPEARYHHGRRSRSPASRFVRRLSDRLHGHPPWSRMYEFLDRLVTIAMPAYPRLPRCIAGKGFDGRGNYNLGVKEQIIFPEIE